jgi:hypothetical protein
MMLKYRIGITLGIALTVFALVIANPEMAYARQAIITPKIAPGAITTPKIAPGAVTLTQTAGTNVTTVPANTQKLVTVLCPSNTIATGGGYSVQKGISVLSSFSAGVVGGRTGWEVVVLNPTSSDLGTTVEVLCASIKS